MRNDFIKIMTICILAATTIFAYKTKAYKPEKINLPPVEYKKSTESIKPTPSETVLPKQPKLSVIIPEHLSYPQTVEQLKKWNQEAPELTEVGVYGQTKKGTDLYFIKITNKNNNNHKSKIIFASTIHGNETLAAGVLMAYSGTILHNFGNDKEITNLLNTREIYFIPVVSPDSYGLTRYVDGVDPNRDFPHPNNSAHQSTPSVAALINFFWKIKPCAVISGHTFGRVFLTPYGDTRGANLHQVEYDRIVGEMMKLSNYKSMHVSELYDRPITGSEVDYFYRNGSMPIVIEFGTHQHKPTIKEIKNEFDRTKNAITFFIKEAPECKVKAVGEEIDFSRNTGIARKYFRLASGDLTPIGPY